ncbi:MAG: hypothetical protein CMJ46_16855 [Planctomyces sp.]|nr:hypothetical protein [Planctomyces sp.]
MTLLGIIRAQGTRGNDVRRRRGSVNCFPDHPEDKINGCHRERPQLKYELINESRLTRTPADEVNR